MLEVTQRPQQYVLTWSGWRLDFSWQTDRWQHALWSLQSGSWTRCICSVEGTSADPWPGSPAYQHAYLEKINADVAEVQLLGQSGKNHYSGAIRFDTKQQLVDFDLAVRIQTHPAEPLLLSAYEILPPLGRDDPQHRWALNIDSLSGQPLVEQGWDLSLLPAKSLLNLTMRDLSGIKLEKQRTTLRWKYQWRLRKG